MGKVYAWIIFIVLSGISIYYAISHPYPTHHSMFDKPVEESLNITKTWVDYLDCCSGEKIIENQVHALHQFSQIYHNNIVDWDGYYIDTKYKHRDMSMFGNNHHMSILVKMDPSESDNFADIVLSIS